MATRRDAHAAASRANATEPVDVDALLDEALMMTFPASDPIALHVERFIREDLIAARVHPPAEKREHGTVRTSRKEQDHRSRHM